MPQVVLPFEAKSDKQRETAAFRASIQQSLPPDFQEVTRKNPFLLRYLCMLPLKEIGLPRYCAKLERSMSETRKPNIIYPVKGGTFVHILYDPDDARRHYIIIEPILNENLEPLLQELEMRMLNLSDVLVATKSDDEGSKKATFLRILDELCEVTKSAPVHNTPTKNTQKNGKLPFHPKDLKDLKDLFSRKVDKIQVTPHQLQCLKYLIIRDKLGLGIIEPLVRDTYLEDISCSGMGTIYVEHKIFHSLKTTISFPSHEELDLFVMRLSERMKKPVSIHNPICDATLPDGSRINIVYGKDISKRGSNFTIRRFSETPLSVLELVEMGTLDYNMAGYLAVMIGEGMNTFVCGETASGKTTTLNALTTFIHPNAKIVSIEDTPELQVPHKNWIREVTSTKEGSESGVTMFDLLKAALRQRPNFIIVGEIRGAEGAIAFQAMQTGHSVMATFHAASVERLIQRLTGNPINVPKTYMDNLNLVVIQSAVKLPSGKTGRRMTSICEIVGYDPVNQSFSFVEVFRWDSVNDSFIFSGFGNSYLMEYKIAPKLGIPQFQKKRIYAEIDRRAKVLEKLHKQGVTNFYELLSILAKAKNEGLF